MNILIGIYRKDGVYGDGWVGVDPDATNGYDTHFKFVTIEDRYFQFDRGIIRLENQSEPELNGSWTIRRIFPTGEIEMARAGRGERKGRSGDTLRLNAKNDFSYQYLADIALIRPDFGESLKWEWNPPGIYRKVRFGPAPEHPELEKRLGTLDTMAKIAPGIWRKPHINVNATTIKEFIANYKS